jgi:hypothetical protein
MVAALEARPASGSVEKAASQQTTLQDSPQPPTVTVIDGRRHPESVPPELAWEHFFDNMVTVGFDKREDAEPRPEMVEALSKYNLFIPPEQVRTVLLVSKATIAKIDELRRPLDPEGNGKHQPTKAEIDSAINGVAAAALSGRDELVQRLPRNDMAAVDRYLATKVIPSIKTTVRK